MRAVPGARRCASPGTTYGGHRFRVPVHSRHHETATGHRRRVGSRLAEKHGLYPPGYRVGIRLRSSGATIKIGSPANIDQVGSILVLGGLVRLDLKLDTSIAGSSGDTRFNVKADGSDLVQSRRLPESGFLASTLKTSKRQSRGARTVCLPLLCGSTALTDLIVNSVVAPLVDGLLTPILNLVLPLLGYNLDTSTRRF
ncbi:protein TadG [Pseudomonas aeruginosa]|nr:protein TadG [Pseudomonas aeruginosa]